MGTKSPKTISLIGIKSTKTIPLIEKKIDQKPYASWGKITKNITW